jgi:SAM-dependent methyltransferase
MSDGNTPYRELAARFGQAAQSYDEEMTANPSMRWMRAVSLATLRRTFAPGARLIEIGCGSGEEAVALAREGRLVTATDVAPEMVALTLAKAAAAGVSAAVRGRCLAAGELTQLVAEGEAGRYEGAYSSFGPLNGEPRLEPVAAALAALVRPGGRLVLGVMNRFYPWETLWYALHGKGRAAARRWGGLARAGVSAQVGERVSTWYYTPRAVRRAFRPAFRPCSCRALPLLLPPPYASSLWERTPRLWAALAGWEERLAPRWPWSALGDHFLLVLERV